MPNASAVLWTGGKDSALALYRAAEEGHRIALLVTFVPAESPDFRAHPIELMRSQASLLALEHVTISVEKPYRAGYIEALRDLHERFAINEVITGDIDLVDGYPYWIVECCSGLGVEVFRPLWQQNRMALLRSVVNSGIEARITYIAENTLPNSWLGRTIDENFITEIDQLAHSAHIDVCGENGEYHSMVSLFSEQYLRTVAGASTTCYPVAKLTKG